MPTAEPPAVADARARRNLAVLVAAQVVLGSQLPVTFILGGLAGQMLAPSRCLATLPITVIIVGSMLSAPLLAEPDAAPRPPRSASCSAPSAAASARRSARWRWSAAPSALFLAGSLLPGSTCRRRASSASPPPTAPARASAPGRSPTSWAPGLASAVARAAAGQADRRRAGAGALRRRLCRRRGAEPRRRLALRLPRQPAAARRRPPTAPRGPLAARAAAHAAHRRRDDLRHGHLRADEPGDDLDAARHRRLRLRHRPGRRRRLGPRAGDVRAVVLHRPPDRPLRRRAGDRRRPRRSSPPPGRWRWPGVTLGHFSRRAGAARARLELRLHRRHRDADRGAHRPRSAAGCRG